MIYAIADLHLDHTGTKSMNIFGSLWYNHQEKIVKNWESLVNDDDLVLIPGDISWAMKLEEAVEDLKFIDDLPGTKILMKGNHDYWWQSLSKNEKLGFSTLRYLQNNAFIYKGIGISGTRGWSNIDIETEGDQHSKKVYLRELIRLELSLKELTKLKPEFKISMLHYPPFDKSGKPNEFVTLMKSYGVDLCLYGHLHGYGHKYIQEGLIDGIKFFCVAGDFIHFKPKFIIGR